MPLGFVHIQHLPGLSGQRGIEEEEPFGDILMDGTLAHTEFFCGLSDRRIRIDDVMGDLRDTFFYIFFQRIPPGTCFYSL